MFSSIQFDKLQTVEKLFVKYYDSLIHTLMSQCLISSSNVKQILKGKIYADCFQQRKVAFVNTAPF